MLEQQPTAAAGIVELHVATGDWPYAIEAYSKLITERTTDATLLSKRAAAYIATEQWESAKADWLRATKLQPGLLEQAFVAFRNAEQWRTASEFGLQNLEHHPQLGSLDWLEVASVLAMQGNDEAYAEFCSRMSRKFADSGKLEDAERTVKAYAFRPVTIDPRQLPAERFTNALDRRTAPAWFLPWGWSTRALLAWRTNDPDLAIEYVAESEGSNPGDFAHAMNLVVHAMAEHQLQHQDEAQKVFDEASQLMTRLNEDPSLKDHRDLLFAEILFREAEATINSQPEPEPK